VDGTLTWGHLSSSHVRIIKNNRGCHLTGITAGRDTIHDCRPYSRVRQNCGRREDEDDVGSDLEYEAIIFYEKFTDGRIASLRNTPSTVREMTERKRRHPGVPYEGGCVKG